MANYIDKPWNFEAIIILITNDLCVAKLYDDLENELNSLLS